jgi:hypothetical protein
VTLINDEYNDCWVWVKNHNHNLELSPQFDYEQDTVQWRDRIKDMLKQQPKETHEFTHQPIY